MRAYSLSHVGDRELLHGLASLLARDRATTAALLAHLAEVDARRLYLPAAYPSMYSYCVHELHLSEEAAFKRIRAARAARRFPALLEAVAEGRLHLCGVVLLAPHLTPENAGELLRVAEHRSKAEIGEWLAQRFPRPNPPQTVEAISPPSSPAEPIELAPGPVEPHAPGRVRDLQLVPGAVEAPAPPKVTPLAPERFALQLTIGRSTHDKLRYAQELLGHQLPSGDLSRVLDRALDALIEQLERRKFAATARPRPSQRPGRNPRHIPAHVRRAVWQRDAGRCTFVSAAGRRCPARRMLEFDHIEEVARGGRASVAGIRLRCRTHNQYGAECAFGAEFMRHKREEAQRRTQARRQETQARAADERRRKAAEARAAAVEVITPLRLLGFRVDEARRAAALCETIPDAPLEQRVRRALTFFHPRPPTSTPAARR